MYWTLVGQCSISKAVTISSSKVVYLVVYPLYLFLDVPVLMC